MTEKKEWLNDLRVRVQGADHVKAPEGLLDDIKREMIRRGVAPARTAGKGTHISHMWVYGAACAAAILAVGLYMGGLFNNSQPSNPSVLTSKSQKIENHRGDINIAETTGNEYQKGHVNGSNAVSSIFKGLRDDARGVAQGCNDMGEKMVKETSPRSETVDESTTKSDMTGAPSVDNPIVSSVPGRLQEGGTAVQPRFEADKNYNSNFSIGVSYIGASGVVHSTKGIVLTSSDPYGEHKPDFSADEKPHNIITKEDMNTVSRHSRPVKVGLSLRYNLNNRWSLQSGLTYSKLSSTFSCQKGKEGTTSKQSLHYVGVPLTVSYSFIKTKHVNVYVTAGGEAEKLVSGTMQYSSRSFDKGITNSTVVKEKVPQFSVNGAVGAEYYLSKGISFYAEPGISHYLNNGSKVDNVYKDTPTSLNVNIGFRFSLNR